MRSRGFVDAGLALLLVAIAIGIYRKVLRLWWMFDDPYHLNLISATPFRALTTRVFWHQFSTPIFTPLLLMSLKLDLKYFGARAEPFYIHQLVAFALIAPLLYFVLRLWLHPAPAFAAALASIVGVPVLSAVPLLMLRHYVEGAVFALASVLTYVIGVRGRRMSVSIVSALLFLAAALCKEIYAPLIAVLALIPEGTLRERFRALVPQAVAAAAYAGLRIFMIGLGMEAYGWAVDPAKRKMLIATLPLRAFAQLGGEQGGLALALPLTLFACIVIVALRFPRAIPLMIVGLAAALLPIIPVATQLQPRWSFVLWFLVIACAAFAPRAMPRVGTAVFCAAIVAAFAVERIEWPRTYREYRRMSDETIVVAGLAPGEVLRNPKTPAETMAQLEGFTHTAGQAFYDDLPLCDGRIPVRRLFGYDEQRHRIVETSRDVLTRSCSEVRPNAKLSLKMTFAADSSMLWTAGPYTNGQYAFILSEGVVTYDVPRVGGFRAPGLEHFNMRVRYTAPEGWRTYSPMLPVDVHGKPVVFERL